MDELAANPLMLLCIYRPEREHRCWQISDVASRKCLERYTEITLRKLSGTQSRQLVESLLTIENLPVATKDMILAKSEGNPFFIEEVIRYLIDGDLVYREDDRWKARDEIADIDVPDTIQSVLLSRVDRLESETKYILQCASVIGRLFRYRLLDHLAQHERDLEEHLSQLEERELIHEERTVPELEYAFKHALTQEATYQGILERRRKGFHQRIAEGIEGLYTDRIEDFYEELAHHYRLSGNREKTIDYLLKSGIKLMKQYANQEALSYFNEAEKLIAESGIEYREEKAILYKKRGSLHGRLGQWVKALRDHEEALRWTDDPHDRAGLYLGLGSSRKDADHGRRTWELGLQELPDGDKSKQRIRLEKSMLTFSGGEDALRTIHHLAGICQEMGYEELLADVYLEIARKQSFMGNYSDEYSQKAIAIAERLGDLPSLQKIYSTLAGIMLWVRTGVEWIPRSIPHFIRAIEIAEQIGDIRMQATELARLGDAYRRLGEYDKAIESSERALDILSETKDLVILSHASFVIEAYAMRGQENLVISTYKRIMCALALLELDEESQSMSLLITQDGSFPGCYNIYRPYLEFRKSYIIMGKESEFPGIARETLEELLTHVDSRPQIAWYHLMLMDLCLELEDMSSARNHAEEAVSIVDGMGRSHYMSGLYPAYILLDDIETADELAYTYLTHESHPMKFPSIHSNAIFSMELTYRRFGQIEAFERICDRLETEHRDELEERGINQFHLKPAEHHGSFPLLEFEDSFDWNNTELPPAPWEWIDPDGTSSYEVHHDPSCMKITSVYGSDIRGGPIMAPRFSRQFSGDFAIETRIGEDKYGGILIWKDGEAVALYRWIWSGGPIVLRYQRTVTSLGALEADMLTLRLERTGKMFRAYCSGDGENWYSCGWTECEMEDPVQVGIFASCHENAMQATTSFDYVKIFRA